MLHTDDRAWITALARTHLLEGRLSEDIDLYTADRAAIAPVLTNRWQTTVRREYPRLSWEPRLASVVDVEPALLRSPDDAVAVRVQLIQADAGYLRWPTQVTSIAPRYRDAVSVELRVPTRGACPPILAQSHRNSAGKPSSRTSAVFQLMPRLPSSACVRRGQPRPDGTTSRRTSRSISGVRHTGARRRTLRLSVTPTGSTGCRT